MTNNYTITACFLPNEHRSFIVPELYTHIDTLFFLYELHVGNDLLIYPSRSDKEAFVVDDQSDNDIFDFFVCKHKVEQKDEIVGVFTKWLTRFYEHHYHRQPTEEEIQNALEKSKEEAISRMKNYEIKDK